jgi:hypothetical protein
MLAAGCAGLGLVSGLQAQERLSIQSASANVCNCGRWTCPICQQRRHCPEEGGPLQTDTRREKPPATVAPGEPGVVPEVPETFPEAPVAPLDTEIAALGDNFGASAGQYGAVPNMIGDFFGTGTSTSIIVVSYPLIAQGFVVSETGPGAADGVIAFEVGTDSVPNDFFSVGLGADNLPPSPDADTFQVSVPVPPSDVVLPPTPAGFGPTTGVATNPAGTYQSGDFWDVVYRRSATVVIPSSAGMVVGRMKLAENVSPIPRDRVFFNYSFFDNVPLRSPGINVSRFTPGFEKTFLNEIASFEFRAPFASTLNSQFSVDTPASSGHVEFGDTFLALKALLMVRSTWAMSGGLSVTLPTADDTTVALSDGTELVKFDNKSVHVMPFVGGLWTPNDRFFAQGFVQVDVDANGDPVYVNRFGTGLLSSGRMQETNFMYLDLGMGYWLYRPNANTAGCITGIAPTLEIHHNASLQPTDVIQSGPFQIGQRQQNIQITDVVIGAAIECNSRSTISVGYVAPIGNTADQPFDGELRVFWNRWF